jgi:hypothetical protein
VKVRRGALIWSTEAHGTEIPCRFATATQNGKEGPPESRTGQRERVTVVH